jgi:dienelactone hydrolase
MPGAARIASGVAVAVLLAGCSRGHHPVLSVTPAEGLLDRPFEIRMSGLHRDERAAFAISARSHLGRLWRTELRARADEQGRVDLRNLYLIADLRPVRESAAADYLPWSVQVTITARTGSTRLTKRARRIVQPPSVSITNERPGRVGFYGAWLTSSNMKHHPAILLLGGSEGGLPLDPTAYLLAAHGYPVLALAYFRVPGLPPSLLQIPLEYFQHALEWMRSQPQVDPAHVVPYGVSRGGELSLLLASTFPNLVHGAISFVGADSVVPSSVNLNLPAWTYRGKALPVFMPLTRISGPVFAVGGGSDLLWPSGFYVKDIKQQLRGHDPRDVTIVYPRAGHGIGLGVPNIPITTTIVSSIHGVLNLGGTPEADQAARADAWPRVLRFLNQLSTK